MSHINMYLYVCAFIYIFAVRHILSHLVNLKMILTQNFGTNVSDFYYDLFHSK